MLEYFGKIMTGVFGKITTAFSEALGIDDSEGGVRGLLATLEGDLEKIFQFKTLRKDIASGGGGFGGFVDAMGKRLEPLFDYLKDKFIQAMESAFAWIGENININTKAFLPEFMGGGGPLITTKGGLAKGKIGAMVAAGQGAKGGFGKLAGAQDTSGFSPEEMAGWATLNDALNDLGIGATEFTSDSKSAYGRSSSCE